MPRVKQASKKKRVTKAAVPALGAAGLTFSLAGGASASSGIPGDDGQIPCGEGAATRTSLYRSGDADRRTRVELVVQSTSLMERASRPF